MSTDRYSSPLSERYASKEMQYIFSQDKKFSTWRKLWIALAETEMELGLSQDGKPVITQEMIDEMKANVDNINYDVARAREAQVRHDVMSHVYAFGQQCPKAAGIIHLGATSCYVGDNTDIIIMREGLMLIRSKVVRVLAALAQFADTYKAMPTLGFTHFQAAQMVTVGKRATLWMNELLMDLSELNFRIEHMQLLGSKGHRRVLWSFLPGIQIKSKTWRRKLRQKWALIPLFRFLGKLIPGKWMLPLYRRFLVLRRALPSLPQISGCCAI